MNDRRSCYECKHMPVCSLHRQVKNVIHGHLTWVNIENGEEPNAITIYSQLAEICKMFAVEELDPEFQVKEG